MSRSSLEATESKEHPFTNSTNKFKSVTESKARKLVKSWKWWMNVILTFELTTLHNGAKLFFIQQFCFYLTNQFDRFGFRLETLLVEPNHYSQNSSSKVEEVVFFAIQSIFFIRRFGILVADLYRNIIWII